MHLNQRTFMRKNIIRFFIALFLSGLLAQAGYPADSPKVLVASDQWDSSEDVLVQKEIDVSKESASSPVEADEVVVKFKSGTSLSTINRIINEIGSQVVKTNASIGFYQLRITSGQSTSTIVQLLKQNANVIYAEPVYYYQSRFVPNDEKYPHQWNLDNPLMDGIHMQKAWDVTMGDKDTVIAIVDTGVAYESYYDQKNYYYWAPDLAKTHFVPGYDFVNNDAHPNDDNWHGTLLAGIIAQTTNNTLGTAGICPECSIMPVKVLDSTGYGNTVTIAEGIVWAADHGAHVINLSFGGVEPSAVIKDACAYAYNKGSTLICASGNRGLDRLIFPASYDEYCIAVGATRFDETRAYYSDYGPSLDLVAPGGDTRIDQNRDNLGDGIVAMTFGPQGFNDWVYLFGIGTSMAAAQVSGVAGLIISAGVASTPDEVRYVLEKTAEDRGPMGFDSEHGWGMINAHAAVTFTEIKGSSASEPQTTSSSPPDIAETSESSTDTASEVTITDGVDVAGSETTADVPTASSMALAEASLEEVHSRNQMVITGKNDVPMIIENNEYKYLQRLDSYEQCGCKYNYGDLPVSAAFQLSDAVVIAHVNTFKRPGLFPIDGENNLQLFRHFYRVRVLKSLKGPKKGERVLLRYRKTCDPELTVDDPVGFTESCQTAKFCHPRINGGIFLLYLHEDPEGDGYVADVCSRIIPYEEARQTDMPILNQF